MIKDLTYGFYKLDPTPTEKELNQFYREEYIQPCERDEDNDWLNYTLHADVDYDLFDLKKHGNFLDVGCGSGKLMDYLSELGYNCAGVEVRPTNMKHPTWNGSFQTFANQQYLDRLSGCDRKYAGITIMHCLAHLPEPAEAIRDARDMLIPGGRLIVHTGNDYNAIQMGQLDEYGEYWVSRPDIINYFSFKSLRLMLECNGFEVKTIRGDFPMATFLHDGYDYVLGEDGRFCHEARKEFEMALSPEERRTTYESLGFMGLGRCCYMVAEKI